MAFLIYGCLGYLCHYGGKYNGKNLIITECILSDFSLGDYIFALPDSTDKSLKHESGHSYQSQLLGWLYIPVMAVPSILHDLVRYIACKLGKEWDYYSFYTEKRADKSVGKVG